MITKYDKYIKESLSTKIDIKNWLDKIDIIKYTINDDLTVNVNYDVDIRNNNLTKIPVNFNKVNGSFDCSENSLTTLEGCPTIFNGNYFDCHENSLTSLKGCPTNIDGDFYCHSNNLTSLKDCPIAINGIFSCYNNFLEDINDLDSKILIKNIDYIGVSEEVFDKYFEYWINKDFNIIEVLKDKISNKIKQKYSHLFQAKNFDLL